VFEDSRSRRIVFVAHCVLNQNAKIDHCARYPGAMRELSEYLIAAGVGIVQMPCPELIHIGLDRQADPRLPATIESEDTRVAALMRSPDAVALCGRLAGDTVYQVRQYEANGFKVLGIIGINGSPTCGVETNWTAGEEPPGPGVLIQELRDQLLRAGFDVPIRGVKASDSQGALYAAQEFVVPA